MTGIRKGDRKNLFASFVVVASVFAFNAQAMPRSYEALVICEETDGDQWLEAGVVRNRQGLHLMVVEHDDDFGTSKLIFGGDVSEKIRVGAATYQTISGDARLVVKMTRSGQIGDLTVLMDGPGSIDVKKMTCSSEGEMRF